MTLGTILGASFQVLRRNPRPLLGFALLLQGAVMVLSSAIIVIATVLIVTRVATATEENLREITVGSVAAGIIGTLIPIALSYLVYAFVQGVTVLEVQRAILGEKQNLRRLWGRARGRLGALVGWTLLLTGVWTLALVVLVLLGVFFVVTLGPIGGLITVAVVLLGGLGLLALAAWLGTRFSLVASVLMAERLTLGQAIRRSWSLTVGFFWRTLGIQLLVGLMLGIAAQVVTAPASFLPGLLIGIIDPNSTGGAETIAIGLGSLLIVVVLTVAVTAVTSVVQSATAALIYVDLRMRKEGLDLVLSRYIENPAAEEDPYRTAHGPAAAASSR